MNFRITGLDPAPFRHLYGLPEAELARHRARRVTADAKPGFPDRVTLRDAEPGEALLLLNYVHLPADTPYRASHAIFVREGASAAYDAIDDIPEVLRLRDISLRGFSADHDMIDAALVPGTALPDAIVRMFQKETIAYLHAHFATRGCFAARITRDGY